MPPLLEARNIRKVFRGGGQLFGGEVSETIACKDFSLSIDADNPTFTTIAGESGSGKTTIARMLLGVLDPSDGEVLYQGQDVRSLQKDGQQRFRQDVQAIFQDPFEVYNPFYKIDHILTTPNQKFGLAASKTEAYEKIQEALRTVGLRPEETLGRYPHQLSGGQRQRITIARALLLKPKLIIADEPVSMVDASLRATILSSLHTLYRDFGISFIYITHDQGEALTMSDRIAVMSAGIVQQVGNGSDIYNDPATSFVASFVGENNAFSGTVSRAEGNYAVLDTQFGPLRGINNRGLKEGDAAYLFIRPEVLRPSRDGDAEGDTMFETVTIKEEFEGSFLHVFLKSDNDQKPFKMAIVNDAGVQRRDPGTPVKVSFDPDRAVALPVGELADE